MVVIEPTVETTREEKTTPHANNNNNIDASDGFETASEGEISDNEDDKTAQNQQQQQKEKVIVVENVTKQGESQVVNTVESELKALEEANNLKLQGNSFYGSGQYEEALKQYELALQIAPDIPSSVELRSICHSNRGMCFLKMVKYEDTVKECTKALQLNPTYLKALIRRGEAHEKLKEYVESLADMKKVLELDPSNDQVRRAIRRLEPLATEQQERMKEEMIGKLKEMGNSILGRFGMSVDNFKTVKDPNTGSYSVQFQK